LKRAWRVLHDRLGQVVGLGENPRRLAAAWAVGVAISFSPFVGLQTALALLVAVVFRLKKVDVLLGTLVINPWTFPLYFPAAVLVGRWLAGIPIPSITVPDPERVFQVAMWREQAEWLKPVLASWLIGASACAIVGGAVTFYGLCRAIVTVRQHHHAE
jgi:uncharacterized protein (DUF2062 family)